MVVCDAVCLKWECLSIGNDAVRDFVNWMEGGGTSRSDEQGGGGC
jgi:hypothetical protein